MLFFKTWISQNKKSRGKKHSAGSNFCFIGLKIVKFYSNFYFIILKNLCMPNMSCCCFFFHFCGAKKGFLALPPDAEVFHRKKKAQVLIFFVANTVLILLFSYFDKSLWKKMPFVIQLTPLENPWSGHTQKMHFLLPTYL